VTLESLNKRQSKTYGGLVTQLLIPGNLWWR